MDAIRTAIMNNRFNAIVEEGSSVIFRTAHTTFVKLSQTTSARSPPPTVICSLSDDVWSERIHGLGSEAMIDYVGINNIYPGDILVTNDPFASDGMVTHLMDITLLYPIFSGGKLIAFGWSFVHCSDIGGAVPGSINPANSEIFQEGLRIRPTKLYERGGPERDHPRHLHGQQPHPHRALG